MSEFKPKNIVYFSLSEHHVFSLHLFEKKVSYSAEIFQCSRNVRPTSQHRYLHYAITGQHNTTVADITTLGRINLPRQKLKYNSVCVRLCRPHSQLHPSAYFGSTATYLVRTIKEFRCIVLNFIFRTRVVYKIQFPEFGILSRNRDVNELFAFSDTFVGTLPPPQSPPPPDAYIYSDRDL